jgi:hypothetical protein
MLLSGSHYVSVVSHSATAKVTTAPDNKGYYLTLPNLIQKEHIFIHTFILYLVFAITPHEIASTGCIFSKLIYTSIESTLLVLPIDLTLLDDTNS